MGNFRRNQGGFGRGNRSGGSSTGERSSGFGNRGGFGGRSSGGSYGGRSSGGGFGGRGRDSGRDRRSFEEHEVTCDKCGKKTTVPFKPTSGKPIYCKECFSSFGSKSNSSVSSGISQDQFSQLNTKLDKVLEL